MKGIGNENNRVKDKLSQIEIIINLYGKFNIIDSDSGTGKTFFI